MSSTRQRRRAEHERVADPGLVDHLLVQLADPRAHAVGAARRHHGEQPAVGDRAAGGDGQPLRTGAARSCVGDPVPGDPGAQLAELLARVAPGQHVEHGVQRRLGQRGERGGPAHDGGQLGQRPRLQRDHRHDVLGQHVQRVARVAHRLDRAGRHPLGDHRARHEIAPVLREHHAAWTRPRPGGPRGRPAAGRRPRSAAPRPGSRGRPRPCRCPAPGWTWPRRRAARRAFSSSSTSVRCSRDIEPWCALAPRWPPRRRRARTARSPRPGTSSSSCAPSASSAASSLSRAVSRSASRRELANTIVDRCARTRSRTRCARRRARSTAAGPCPPPSRPPPRRSCPARAVRRARRGRAPVPRPAPRRSSASRGWTTSTGRPPARNVRHLVERADGRPTARSAAPGRSSSSSSRSRDSARWAPRLVPATACTSSTITVLDPAQRLPGGRGEQQEQRLGRGDQHVGRGAGELRAARRPGCRRCACRP